MTNVPQIGFYVMNPEVVRINRDTCILIFNFNDGDADVTKGAIYIRDLRFDTAEPVIYNFPADIDESMLDPKKGVTGKCTILLTPDKVSPRLDSVHLKFGDTTSFEVYVKDAKNNKSNSFITPSLKMVW
jgi:hypothetical protein